MFSSNVKGIFCDFNASLVSNNAEALRFDSTLCHVSAKIPMN